jgi:flagellar hook-length control protein FliK
MVEALSQTQTQISSGQEGAVSVIPVKKGKGKSALGAFSRLLDGLRGGPQGNFSKEITGGGKISVEDGKEANRNLQKTNLKDKKKTSSSGGEGADLIPVFLELVSGRADTADFMAAPSAEQELAAGRIEDQTLGEKDAAGKISFKAASPKGEKALPAKQVQEIPPGHEAGLEEAALKDTVFREEGETDAVRLSAGEEKGPKVSEARRPAESSVQNTELDLDPAPEKMLYNLSVPAENAGRPLQNKPSGNQAHKTEAAFSRKTRERSSAYVRESDIRELGVTELAREVKPQTTGSVPGAGEQEIPVDLRNSETVDGIAERNSGTGQASGEGGFGDLLSRELNRGLSTDIVKHASIILRGNDSGLIRLSLKPETLGNVKIRLEMSENKIIGHITVESREALRAFEQEAPVLEAAFKEAGFEGASLDMSLASGNGSGGDGGRTDQDIFSSLRIAASYDAASVVAEDGSDTAGGKGMYAAVRSAINMLA